MDKLVLFITCVDCSSVWCTSPHALAAGHEYFAEVSEDFIEDEFNLTGLAGIVGFYKVIQALTYCYTSKSILGSSRDDTGR